MEKKKKEDNYEPLKKKVNIFDTHLNKRHMTEFLTDSS